MKYAILMIFLVLLTMVAFIEGAEKQAKYECLRVIEYCEQYEDAGACDYVPEHCWNVEEEE